MSSIDFIEKFKALPNLEKKNIIFSIIITILVHVLIIFVLTPSSSSKDEIVKKPNFIKAKILIKGEKDGTNKFNSKTDKIRTKKKTFLPDRAKKETVVKKVVTKKKVVVKKTIPSKNVVPLKKKDDKIKDVKVKKEKELTDKERSSALLSLRKINIALPSDKKSDKNGGLGKRKGGKDGVEDGNETDPTKVLAGSLYERRVATRIKSRWKSPVLDKNNKKLSYSIRIFIKKDGSFKFNILKKSGNMFFDDSVSKVLKKISKVEAPAPNFQKYYEEKGLVINFFPKN